MAFLIFQLAFIMARLSIYNLFFFLMAPNPDIIGMHKNAIIISKKKVKKQTDKKTKNFVTLVFFKPHKWEYKWKNDIFKRYFILTKT